MNINRLVFHQSIIIKWLRERDSFFWQTSRHGSRLGLTFTGGKNENAYYMVHFDLESQTSNTCPKLSKCWLENIAANAMDRL